MTFRARLSFCTFVTTAHMDTFGLHLLHGLAFYVAVTRLIFVLRYLLRTPVTVDHRTSLHYRTTTSYTLYVYHYCASRTHLHTTTYLALHITYGRSTCTHAFARYVYGPLHFTVVTPLIILPFSLFLPFYRVYYRAICIRSLSSIGTGCLPDRSTTFPDTVDSRFAFTIPIATTRFGYSRICLSPFTWTTRVLSVAVTLILPHTHHVPGRLPVYGISFAFRARFDLTPVDVHRVPTPATLCARLVPLRCYVVLPCIYHARLRCCYVYRFRYYVTRLHTLHTHFAIVTRTTLHTTPVRYTHRYRLRSVPHRLLPVLRTHRLHVPFTLRSHLDTLPHPLPVRFYSPHVGYRHSVRCFLHTTAPVFRLHRSTRFTRLVACYVATHRYRYPFILPLRCSLYALYVTGLRTFSFHRSFHAFATEHVVPRYTVLLVLHTILFVTTTTRIPLRTAPRTTLRLVAGLVTLLSHVTTFR